MRYFTLWLVCILRRNHKDYKIEANYLTKLGCIALKKKCIKFKVQRMTIKSVDLSEGFLYFQSNGIVQYISQQEVQFRV